MEKYDYEILENYMINYHDLVDTFKNKRNEVSEQQFNRIENIVTGITEVYNNATLKEQQMIKMLWWDRQPYDIIANVLDTTETTIKHARDAILRRVAKASVYI